VFNLADVSSTVGAALVILEEFLQWRRDRNERAIGRLTGRQPQGFRHRIQRSPMPDTFKAILITRDEDKKQSVP
jgi:hypothetical protein